MVIKEQQINQSGYWMTLVKEGNDFIIAFTDKALLGKIEFSADEDLASGMFKYLDDRLSKINTAQVEFWISKLTEMKNGRSVYFYLAVADKELSLKDITSITARSSMQLEEDEFQVFITDGTSAVGKFEQVADDKFAFKFDI